MSDIDQAPLLEGDFYAGAFGPSMLLVLTSPEAVSWFRGVFDGLAEAEPGAEFRLDSQPGVDLGVAVTGLLLRRVERASARHLMHDGAGRFTWSCTADEWREASLLLEPLLAGPGHQYLTSETDDDAIVEVSYGEEHGPELESDRHRASGK